ncbi:bacillithiol biosynthesis deacetylase BshB2 [Paenibacillus sp. GP183]|jgi:bacillithiol biosynthesis deacetylase BshB2|uniref:bacillithiol biosynthesis deacetylase BshB2 n=1 Tax=Paenibacillus sp. GP183 TaxID=1882751 RepID=UPI000899A7C0|nr:bacillithiol biosynthesis deacetylase BshB2 [Paenibacillus sp. GP183]SEC27876.1 bacillithiol biosynthesis deacetylase BshB2 [Paenibacillus sp. GP183]
MTQPVLAVFPHPDDETFGKAGALSLHAQAGVPITLICATSGQMGRRMGNPFFANRETLSLIREKELQDACDMIGIQDIRLWRMLDKTLQFEDPEELADRIFEVIQEIRPFRVYTYYPEHGVHPDHDALAAATIIAIQRLPKEQRPEIYASAFSKNCLEVLGPPNIIMDVSSVLDRKLAALRAHRSQSEVFTKKLDQEFAEHPERKNEIFASQMIEKYWTYQWPEVL